MSIVNGDMYIWGGLVSDSQMAGNEMHILKLSNTGSLLPLYKCIPALARDGDDVPGPRAAHTACVIENRIVVYGGFADTATKSAISEGGRVWVFDPESLQWSHLDVANAKFPTLADHAAVVRGNNLIVHGGRNSSNANATTDTWSFDMSSRTWVELPRITQASDSNGIRALTPPNLAIVDEKLYVISGSADLNCRIHTLNLKEDAVREWRSLDFEKPGPRPRKGAGLISLSTGMGRTYLLFMLGEKDEHPNSGGGSEMEEKEPEYWSGLWSLQLPLTGTTPANVKDIARDKLGIDSHESKWAEVEIVVEEEETGAMEGKSHPGPRAYFASAGVSGTKVALWGGLNPRKEAQGDGWLVELKV